jgi:hypothetical protein
MQNEKVVFVKCQLSRGGFPSECVFHLASPNGGCFAGIAPLHYCYDAARKPLRTELRSGQKIERLVAGVEIKRDPGQSVRVYLPDGELYEVSEDLVFLTGASGRVPVGS